MKKQLKTPAKTRQQIAEEFGLHVNTLMRKLKRANINLPKGLLLPKEQEKIYTALGNPIKPNRDKDG